jgi:hypothetical protein
MRYYNQPAAQSGIVIELSPELQETAVMIERARCWFRHAAATERRAVEIVTPSTFAISLTPTILIT